MPRSTIIENRFENRRFSGRKKRAPLILGDFTREPYLRLAKYTGQHHVEECDNGVISHRGFKQYGAWTYVEKHFPQMKEIYAEQTMRELTEDIFEQRVCRGSYNYKEQGPRRAQISTEHYRHPDNRHFLPYVTGWYADRQVVTDYEIAIMMGKIWLQKEKEQAALLKEFGI